MQSTSKTGMARLLEIATMKKPLVISAVVLASLAGVASFIPYIVIYMVIQEAVSVWPDIGTLNTALMIRYGWLAFGGVMLNVLLYFGALICSHLAAFGTLYELKVNFISHLAKVPLGFHVLIGSGKLRKIMDENIEKIEKFIAHQLPDIVASFVAPVVMVVIMLVVDWRFGLAVLVGVVIAFMIQFSFYGNGGAQKKMAAYQSAMEEMSNASVEYIRGISVVKAFMQTAYSFHRLHDTIKKHTEVVIPYTFSFKLAMTAFTALINNLYLFVVPVGILVGTGADDYRAFVATLIFYLVFVPAIAGILMKIMYVNTNSMQIISGVAAMDAILSEPELAWPESPKKANSYGVEFRDVTFSYDKEGKIEALTGVSFTATQGEITAIVGPSGGGKSTIAHLIPRFFEVGGGSINLGGIDIREIDPPDLMHHVSFVFQDVFLFKQSVRDNIRMGKSDATEEQIVAAAKAAQCHDFIMKLPDGYGTVIGTNNVHLSGGEKQRIAIARAIVKDAPVVVLDEATAFADPENEHLIQKAFEVLMDGKTVVIIAHRLSTIQNADKIIVIENGRVTEEGRHEDLLGLSGRYAAMWQVYNETKGWQVRGAIQNA